jgi:hypothetical protein
LRRDFAAARRALPPCRRAAFGDRSSSDQLICLFISVGFGRYRHIEAAERDGNKAIFYQVSRYQVSQFCAAWPGPIL